MATRSRASCRAIEVRSTASGLHFCRTRRPFPRPNGVLDGVEHLGDLGEELAGEVLSLGKAPRFALGATRTVVNRLEAFDQLIEVLQSPGTLENLEVLDQPGDP